MSDKSSKKKAPTPSRGPNLFVIIVVALLIGAMVLSAPAMVRGIQESFRAKTLIDNGDGTFSIPEEAQTAQNNNANAYMGKVLDQKIQLNRNDMFNYRLQQIANHPYIKDPYQRYQIARFEFNNELNKIIGMENARKMDIVIGKEYLVREIGKRYYSDSEGDPDYQLMKQKNKEVNEQAKGVLKEVLYDHFRTDMFESMPVTEEEVWNSYVLDNVKVSIDYIALENDSVSESEVRKWFSENSDNYQQYKLTRLYFENKEDADAALVEITAAPDSFLDIGNRLRTEDKVINIVYDSEYSFTDDFDDFAFAQTVAATPEGSIGTSVVETTVGSIVFKVDDIKTASISNPEVFQKVQSDYTASNYTRISRNNEELAGKIQAAASRSSLASAARQFGRKVEKAENITFMGYEFNFVNPDQSDDLNFMVSMFKGNRRDVLPVFNYQAGFIVAEIADKTEADEDTYEVTYEDLNSQKMDRKTQELESDYYDIERKKHKIIDNFGLVLKPQNFASEQ
jgi:hypothetical protein